MQPGEVQAQSVFHYFTPCGLEAGSSKFPGVGAAAFSSSRANARCENDGYHSRYYLQSCLFMFFFNDFLLLLLYVRTSIYPEYQFLVIHTVWTYNSRLILVTKLTPSYVREHLFVAEKSPLLLLWRAFAFRNPSGRAAAPPMALVLRCYFLNNSTATVFARDVIETLRYQLLY